MRYRIADFSEIARKTFGFSRIFSRKGKTPEEISSGVFEDGEDAISIEELKSQKSAYVSAYDEGTGDITLMDSSKNEISSTASVCYDKVDSKDTVVFYVNSDDGVGVANGEIRLADYYDDNQAEDHVNVRVYSEDDDQITVLVVDVNNNYTQW